MDCSLNNTEVVKKKRGRKKKSELLSEESKKEVEENPLPKKRGRKPKGGKLIKKPIENNEQTNPLSNVILHLKCSLNDIKIDNFSISDPLSYNPIIPPNIMTYNDNENQYTDFQNDKLNENKDLAYETNEPKELSQTCSICNSRKCTDDIIINNNDEDDDISFKDINQKLKKIKIQLYKNTNPDNKSACFWCTYEFDNPCIVIPKYKLKNIYHCYGCFCSPECAVSHLMNENIDTSSKFERYHLMNHIYCKIYNYNKNIKPAPDPYYTLEKYYGNLTIQEYRQLLKNDRLFMVVDKPLTKVLPELLEENNDFIMNNKQSTTSNSTYQIKRKTNKPNSKNNILIENFGINN